MGVWSSSITGNDTAQDLILDYKAAFYFFDVDTAVQKIDQYVRKLFDESDEQEWCDYFYSLADFMWKKGIITDEIRNKAVEMIDSDFGMSCWTEAGYEKERRKVLAKFRAQITSPQCKPKKINLGYHMEDYFEDGVYIAFKLKTLNKSFIGRKDRQKEFESYNDKYVVIQKVKTRNAYVSPLVPEVCDKWVSYSLLEGIYDSVEDIQPEKLKRVKLHDSLYFSTPSSLFHFKKRDYQIIGKGKLPKNIPEGYTVGLYFEINMPHYNADSELIEALTK